MAFGSCVAQPNSYCFAYAACENIITDFEMNNANIINNTPLKDGTPHDGKKLDDNDVKLLSDTCSKDNIATLEGIRDCTAFCQHHMCCFNDLESENCKIYHADECEAYGVCKILVDGPEDVIVGSVVNNANPTFKADCMQSNLHKNLDSCKTQCERYECCFRGVDSCYKDQALECDEYYVCEEFYMDDDPDGGVGGETQQQSGASNQVQANNNNNPGSNQGTNDAAITKDSGIANAVQAVCALEEEDVTDGAWVTACHALCADYLCCFSTEGTESNCRDLYGNAVCDAYQGCVVLHTSSLEEETSNDNNGMIGDTDNSEDQRQQEIDEVNELCVSKARRDPRLAGKCQLACNARSCCFEDGAFGCSSMNEEWCDEFQACEVMYSGV